MTVPRLAVALLVASFATACHKDDHAVPDDLPQQIDALLEAGDAEGALALLADRSLDDAPALRQLLAEAQIMSGAFDDGLTTLDTLEPSAAVQVLREDACAIGALTAIDDTDLAAARTRIDACADATRIDVASVRALVTALEGTPVDRTGVDALLVAVRGAEASPEIDVAADALERTYVAYSAASEDPAERIFWLAGAFAVAHDAELGQRLINVVQTTADGLAADDPQAAATWYEYLYLERVPGLEVPADVSAAAAVAARQAVFPVFVRNQHTRYLSHFGDADTASGRYDASAHTWTLPGRGDDANTWLYRIYERPKPTNGPDLLTAAGQCEEPGPCTLDVEQVMGVLYRIDDYERAWVEQTGEPLVYPPAQ